MASGALLWPPGALDTKVTRGDAEPSRVLPYRNTRVFAQDHIWSHLSSANTYYLPCMIGVAQVVHLKWQKASTKSSLLEFQTMCPGGGIGRHFGLQNRRSSRGNVGSNPTPGTHSAVETTVWAQSQYTHFVSMPTVQNVA
jgi:hypothetical protein